jgi:predicted metalloprotease
MKLLSLIAIVALATAAVACGATGASSVTESTTPTQTTEAPAPEPTATTTPEPEAEAASLEGAFTYSQMADYLNAIAPMVAQFFEEQYAGIPDPSLVYIPSGRAARGACGYSDGWAYSYCPADQAINVGQDLLWEFYQGAGDAAPAIALAHEWGHHIQLYRDVPFGRTMTESVDFENQADCLSGAWAQYADEQGWLETEDDLADVGTLMQLIGSAESSRRDHGTTAERSEAFDLAYAGGAAACNAYFPDDPVA